MNFPPEPLARLACVTLFVAIAASPAGAAQNAAGAATYGARCSACHAPDGSGDTVIGKSANIPDLRFAPVQSQADAQLQDVIAHGTGRMPGFASSLSDDDIHSVVLYVRQLAKTN